MHRDLSVVAAVFILLYAAVIAPPAFAQGTAPRILGDVNGDSRFTLEDTVATLQVVVGLMAPQPDEREAADVDLDGEVTVNDAILMLRLLVGLPVPSLRPDLSSVNDFVIQLQKVDLAVLGRSAFDLVIMDYSREGDDPSRYTFDDIRRLKRSPGGSKRVLAYLSIGEAESYRWYWEAGWDAGADGLPDPGAPPWLGPENENWKGNYKVKYWDADWQALILRYLDRILEAGFDGVYLDIIDAYEYWGPGGDSRLERPTAAREMVEWVKAVARHARITRQHPRFLVVPQNGDALSVHPDYVGEIDGIGREDLWFDDDRPQSPSTIDEALTSLDRLRVAGKMVLVIDYVTEAAGIAAFYSSARRHGFVPYAATRALDRIVTHEGYEPD